MARPDASTVSRARPAAAVVGLGLKTCHIEQVLAQRPALGFFEVHAENYMVDGGPLHRHLTRVRESYPLSMHGVALSIGGQEPLDAAHLQALKRLLDRYQPEWFSEHLAWSGHGGVFFNDLLPLAYTPRMLDRVCQHVDQAQEFLGRRMLLENPATYLEFEASSIDEGAFIAEVARRTGCGLLLDVTNAHVSCVNHGRDARDYLRRLPLDAVGEIHLAGFARQSDANGDALLIDNHGAPVAPEVWRLYDFVLGLIGPAPTLIERDHDIPALAVLLDEARAAQAHLDAAPAHSSRVEFAP